MNLFFRGIFIFCGLLVLWQSVVTVFHLPPYILPTPLKVIETGYARFDIILMETIPTIIETVLGLILGILLGCITAVTMAFLFMLWWNARLSISSEVEGIFEYFKFSPEIKMYRGFNNLIVKDGSIYSSAIDKLNSKIFLVSFNFE